MADILSAEQVEQIGREAEEWPEEGGPARLARSHEALRAALATAQARCATLQAERDRLQGICNEALPIAQQLEGAVKVLEAERDALEKRCATLRAALEHIAAGIDDPWAQHNERFHAGIAWAQKIARAALPPPAPEAE